MLVDMSQLLYLSLALRVQWPQTISTVIDSTKFYFLNALTINIGKKRLPLCMKQKHNTIYSCFACLPACLIMYIPCNVFDYLECYAGKPTSFYITWLSSVAPLTLFTLFMIIADRCLVRSILVY
jgi:hypothetical protein